MNGSDMTRLVAPFEVKPGSDVDLEADWDPSCTLGFVTKQEAKAARMKGIELLSDLQSRLWAQDTDSVLVVLQAIDAAGKDSLIKHVMTGVNPQGVRVISFGVPSARERDHDYLWRHNRALPRRGEIGIFNRSHYENVIVVRVHPELLETQKLPARLVDDDIWSRRFEEINEWERYLVQNGITVLKYFLYVSKKEQRKRFLRRIDRPDKNWKFSMADIDERRHWDDYIAAYEDAIRNTSTEWAPWHIVPADHKWFTRLVVLASIVQTLERLDPQYPEPPAGHGEQLREARAILEAEE